MNWIGEIYRFRRNMKFRELDDTYLSMSVMEEVIDEYMNKVRHKKLERDFFDSFDTVLRYSNSEPLTYKDILLAKKMFEYGFAAAHIKGNNY